MDHLRRKQSGLGTDRFFYLPDGAFTFFLLALITPFLKKIFRGFTPTARELALTYTMVSVATALAGHDIVRQLVPMIANAGWFATPENEWSDLFFRFMPTWLTITDRRILQGYFEGDDTFWQEHYLNAWRWPIVAWSGLVIVILFMMLCVNIIIRRQWIDHEKLSYPLTTLPVELIGNTSTLFRNQLFWLGFGIAFGLEILAGLNYLFPVIPSLKIKYQLYFSERPWERSRPFAGLRLSICDWVRLPHALGVVVVVLVFLPILGGAARLFQRNGVDNRHRFTNRATRRGMARHWDTRTHHKSPTDFSGPRGRVFV